MNLPLGAFHPLCAALERHQTSTHSCSRSVAELASASRAKNGVFLICRQLQHNIQDLSRQVTALVSQVQDLQGGRQPRRQPASPATPQTSSALITSDDVISDRLVSFNDIQV